MDIECTDNEKRASNPHACQSASAARCVRATVVRNPDREYPDAHRLARAVPSPGRSPVTISMRAAGVAGGLRARIPHATNRANWAYCGHVWETTAPKTARSHTWAPSAAICGHHAMIPERSSAPSPDADDDRRASVRMQLAAHRWPALRPEFPTAVKSASPAVHLSVRISTARAGHGRRSPHREKSRYE